jgi:hypothetical protein
VKESSWAGGEDLGQGGGGLGGVTELVRIHGAREGEVRCTVGESREGIH